MADRIQKTLNRISRATLGALPSTPVAFPEAEGESMPAVAQLDKKQEGYAQRLRASTDGRVVEGKILWLPGPDGRWG